METNCRRCGRRIAPDSEGTWIDFSRSADCAGNATIGAERVAGVPHLPLHAPDFCPTCHRPRMECSGSGYDCMRAAIDYWQTRCEELGRELVELRERIALGLPARSIPLAE